MAKRARLILLTSVVMLMSAAMIPKSWGNTKPNDACLFNQERVDGKCVPKCPQGQELFNNRCVMPCADNQERIRGACVPKCDEAHKRVAETCVPK